MAIYNVSKTFGAQVAAIAIAGATLISGAKTLGPQAATTAVAGANRIASSRTLGPQTASIARSVTDVMTASKTLGPQAASIAMKALLATTADAETLGAQTASAVMAGGTRIAESATLGPQAATAATDGLAPHSYSAMAAIGPVAADVAMGVPASAPPIGEATPAEFSTSSPPNLAQFGLAQQLPNLAPAPAVMPITSSDWSVQLDAPGAPGSGLGKVVQGVGDVAQCVQIILTTPLGTDPLRPTFGCDLWRYIDKPLSIAQPMIVRLGVAALTKWEQRINPKTISIEVTQVTPPAGDGSQSIVTVTGQLKVSGSPLVKVVIPLPAGAFAAFGAAGAVVA